MYDVRKRKILIDEKQKHGQVCRTMTRLAQLGLFALSVFAIGGCGGGGNSGSSDPNTVHGRLATGDQSLSDGTYVDFYTCLAKSDGNATVSMSSSKIDSLLAVGVEQADGSIQTLATDDDSGGGLNAKVQFHATAGTRYYVAAAEASNTPVIGSYTIVFSDILQGIAPATDVSAQSKLGPRLPGHLQWGWTKTTGLLKK